MAPSGWARQELLSAFVQESFFPQASWACELFSFLSQCAWPDTAAHWLFCGFVGRAVPLSSVPHNFQCLSSHHPGSTGGRGTGKAVIPSSQGTKGAKVSQGWTPIVSPHALNPTWHPGIKTRQCPASLQSLAPAMPKLSLWMVNPEPSHTDSHLTCMLSAQTLPCYLRGPLCPPFSRQRLERLPPSSSMLGPPHWSLHVSSPGTSAR